MKSDKPNIDLRRRASRYAIAVGAVALGTLLRYGMNVWVGPLPTYITFYPAVMLAALLGGFWPGIVATVLVDVVTDYWLIPPVSFGITGFPDAVGLGLFSFMGVFMSTVAEFYLRARVKAAAYDKEAALREISRDKEFLASILERASQPFGVGYPDGRLGLINNAFEKLTGYTKDELKSIDWGRELTPPEWRDIEQEKLEYLNRTGQPIRYVKEYMRKDGTRVPIELLVHLVTDSQGNPEYYYSFITDITERKQAEEALRRAKDELELRVQERTAELAKTNEALLAENLERKKAHDIVVRQTRLLQAFFTNTITPLVFLDKNFNFIRVNEAYARACQREEQEFPGRNHFELYPNEENQRIFEQVVATGEIYQAIARPFVFPDHPEWGITYWDWNLTPLLTENNEVEFLVFSLNDVTEKIRLSRSSRKQLQRYMICIIMRPADTSHLTGMVPLSA